MASDALATLQRRVEQQLQRLMQTLASGQDVAPGDRLRLEGWMEAALSLAGADGIDMISTWQQQLARRGQLQCKRDSGADVAAEPVWRVRLDLWQSRAPVVPSTRD